MANVEGTSRDDFEVFARHLKEDTVKQILGTHVNDEQRVTPGTTPRTTFFSGAIVPEEDDADIDEDIRSRVSPTELGLFGNVTSPDDRYHVTIEAKFALYYRVVPKPETAATADVDVPTVYKKRVVDGISADVDLPKTPDDPEWPTIQMDAEKAIRKAARDKINDIREKIQDDPWLLATPIDDSTESDIAEFLDGREDEAEETVEAGLAEEPFTGGEESVPEPRIDFDIELTGALDGDDDSDELWDTLVRVNIKNTTNVGEDDDYTDRDDAIYQTRLRLHPRSPSTIRPIKFRQLEDSYRYDLDVPGQGHNCTVEWTDDDRGIESNTAPVHRQPSFEHKRLEGDADPRFEALADDPLPVLRAIKREMEKYKENTWKPKLKEERNRTSDGSETVTAIKKTIREFQDEIDAFEAGINALEHHEEARELFKAVNEVFIDKVTDDSGNMDYERWRLFQIVFIVSNLPDILGGDASYDIDPNRDEVSLVFIPTGGGKTEAYLALLVFAALFDRKRGKNFGLTSMMRFPLRLLSMQQAQRVHEILMYADRKREEMDLGGDPFSLGYFSGGTANKIEGLIDDAYGQYPGYAKTEEKLDEYRSLLRSFARDWESGDLDGVDVDSHQIIDSCPLCGGDIKTEIDTEEARIVHVCTGECERERMNISATDRAIYANLPTMVLGTQDKLAALGYHYRFRTVVGHVTHRCEEHGYTHADDECLLGGFCDRDKEYAPDAELEPVDFEYPAPTLTIQDELHLVNEELGTFESHYYAAFEKHIEWAAERHDSEYIAPKKIAATATIEEYENQVRHLYNADGQLFPVQGPAYRESFYTTTNGEKTQRYFIGVTPWNRSQINSIVRVLEMHQRRLQDMLEDPAKHKTEVGLDHLDDEAFRRVVAHYYVLVTYVISRNEGARVYKSAENQVNENLSNDGYETVNRAQITGGTGDDDLGVLLEKLENVGEEGGPELQEEVEELIVATSSISHGVDIDALNFMQFFNAPPRMAEYIQASSRVGRKYPGIVLDIFHPVQERDRSHYHYFGKYHQYKDRLVEPVAINRWARHSVKRTFPGLFVSLLLIRDFDLLVDQFNYISNRTKARKIKKATKSIRGIDQGPYTKDLVDLYGDHWETGECPFEDRLETLVGKTFSDVLSGSNELLEDCIVGRKMTSLRDMDEQIPLTISSDHEDIIRRVV